MKFQLMTKALAKDVLGEWWASYEQTLPSDDLFPATFCCVTDDENKPQAVIGFALTEMQTAFLGWLTADPELIGEERNAVIQKLMAGVDEYAKELKFNWLWFPTGHPGIVARLTKMGYVIAKEGKCESLLKDLR